MNKPFIKVGYSTNFISGPSPQKLFGSKALIYVRLRDDLHVRDLLAILL